MAIYLYSEDFANRFNESQGLPKSTLVDLSDTTTWMTEFIALFVGNPVEAHDMSEADFYNNGYGALPDAIIAYAEEELNGLFEFYMEYDSEGALVDELKEERIIKAPAQDKLGEQLFRIYSVTKSHDSDRVIVKAQHITYDLANNYIEEYVANNLTKKQAMEKIGSSTVRPHPFVVTSSNTTTRSSTRLYRTNPLQMVAGMSGSILQIWGGQIERDNFRLVMHDRRGSDDGVAVTYEKNITGLEATIDISGLVTRIHPFVKIEASDGAPERLIELPDKYIDSPLINAYSQVYIEPLDLSQDERIDVDGKTDAQIRAQIQAIAERYFDETGNDKPKATMDVEFAHLWETEEYKDVAPLELVGMGDTVTVRHSKLGVDATAIVNYIRYNCLTGTNEEVKLGGAKARMSDAISRIERVEERVNEVQDDANRAIVSANGKNTTYYGPDEPDVNAIKGDTWFKVVDGEYTRTYRYDGIEWQLIIDMDSHEAKQEAQQAIDAANQAIGDVANLTTITETIGLQVIDLEEDVSTQYTQLSDAINLRVAKGDVLSQINLEAGRTLIDTDKLVLSANTTHVTGDFKLDGSAHIQDASIGTAQIGTIDAAIANIINLSANSIVGGILQSQNSNTTFNLNSGELHMENADITLGGGASIDFLNSNNGILYRLYDSQSGFSRVAGFGVGNALGGRYPFAHMGTTGTYDMDTLSPYYSGFIANTTARIADGGANSVNGYRFMMRSTAVNWDKGLEFDFFGGNPYIRPINGHEFDYDLGTSAYRFKSAYVDRIRASSDFMITHYSSVSGTAGWRLETNYSGEGNDITLRGINGGTYEYQIGRPATNYRIRHIFLKNSPNVSSDERLKTDISNLDLGLDFITKIEAKQFRLKQSQAQLLRGVDKNPVQYGIIAQQVNSVLADFGVSDSSLITQSEDGYFGAQYEQFIPILIKSVQELDTKLTDNVEFLKLKVQYLEQKIKLLEAS